MTWQTSIEKIFAPEPVEFSIVSTCILGASILVKLYMWFYNRRVSAKIDSSAMRATATDSLSDACATLAVLISTLVAHFTGVNIDAYAGALVALMILWAGYNAAKDTITPLLGRAPDPRAGAPHPARLCASIKKLSACMTSSSTNTAQAT